MLEILHGFVFQTQEAKVSHDTDIENGLEDMGSGKGKVGPSERVA